MFKVNDYVVYGLTGVCQITDIQKDKLPNDQESELYVLKPVFSDNMTIKIPVNNRKVPMRKTISKKEALELIAVMPQQETEWVEDNRVRNQTFKAALRNGKSVDWARIIKTIYLERTEKAAAGKKLAKTDEDIFHTAEKQLNEELAIALGISPDEVASFISEHIPDEK